MTWQCEQKIRRGTAEVNEPPVATVTTMDISKQLSANGYEIDRRDIHLEEPIKLLGQHKATVKMGEGLDAEITIVVEKLG